MNKFALAIYLTLALIAPALSAESALNSDDPVIRILGVAQDAGFPQAGCYEARCSPAWEDRNQQQAATALAIIDPSTKQTILFEATPQLPQQLYELHKRAPVDEYQIKGVFITHAHIGHYTGLMYFGHEAQGAQNVPVFVMPRLRNFLENNGPWSQLVEFNNIQLQTLQADKAHTVGRITVQPFTVPHRDEFSETVGFKISSPSKSAIFIPDIDKWEKWQQSLPELIMDVDYAFLDATFYADGELPNRDMSKVPHPLVTDTMLKLISLNEHHRNKVWFIHFNHTNPLLDPQSSAAQQVRSKGFNISSTGQELPF